VSASDRERPLAAGVNGPLMARRPEGPKADRPLMRPDIPQLRWTVRVLCAVAGRCRSSLVAAVAVTVAVSSALVTIVQAAEAKRVPRSTLDSSRLP
jgi:hypothetical protein